MKPFTLLDRVLLVATAAAYIAVLLAYLGYLPGNRLDYRLAALVLTFGSLVSMKVARRKDPSE